MECRERYFLIAADLSFTGDEPYFEAVDRAGVYPITQQYASECGYSVSVLPQPGHIELKASYFSCHTENKDDKMFTFNFNLIATDKGKQVAYVLNKTCSPPLAWSPREVTCEVNYMEAYMSATSAWQVMFHRAGLQMAPMTLSEARTQHYVFDLTDGRLVFRTPYGQPDSFENTVNGVPLEVIHATLFSRQGWVVLMVDLVAACSMYEGSLDNGYLVWKTPELLYPKVPVIDAQIKTGLNGNLLEQSTSEERGYAVEKHNATIQLKVPYNTEGAYRKSFVVGDLYEFYILNMYMELVLLDNNHVDTRLRFHRPLSTPLLRHQIVTENRTVVEDREFNIYIGSIPQDVELAAVELNGKEFTVLFKELSMCTNCSSSSMCTICVAALSNTYSYTLKMPFSDSIVIQKFHRTDEILRYKLDIKYTLVVLPENKPFYHLASIVTSVNATPPAIAAICSEWGIGFRMDHKPTNYLWDISIGPELLTAELADRHRYVMHNDSQTLLLDVPLLTYGYEYTDISLEKFSGTFEILIKDHETSEIHRSVLKTCSFSTSELISCSRNGQMTVVANVSLVIPTGGMPGSTHLNKNCTPIDADSTRVLFSIPLNSCGTTIKIVNQQVMYENEISYTPATTDKMASNVTHKVTVQCSYTLTWLYRLFSVFRFESDTVGVGRIIHTVSTTEGLQSTTLRPTTIPSTTESPYRLTLPFHPVSYYFRVPTQGLKSEEGETV
ncbi:zona pellucida protein AX 4 [Thalassophryne amazonica]|uniref:zona pellucida protein AX 4 n=1 Tax=Thalassophryne amazonica TaxID=390379 RepID=UPI0014715060|nr:zona pellucida protein AX 4 [Thalassophryne amazonica]